MSKASCARHYAPQGMETPPPTLLRIIPHHRPFLMAILGLYHRIPVLNDPLRQRRPDRACRRCHPRPARRFIHPAEQPPNRIVPHHRLQATDLAHRWIFPQPLHRVEAEKLSWGGCTSGDLWGEGDGSFQLRRNWFGPL